MREQMRRLGVFVGCVVLMATVAVPAWVIVSGSLNVWVEP